MEHDKKISAREAAIAVLKKAEEVLKSTGLMKAAAFNPDIKGVHNASGGASSAGIAVRGAKRDTDHAESGKASSPAIERSMAKDKIKNAKSYHKQVLGEMKAMPKPDLGKGEMPPTEHDVTPPEGIHPDKEVSPEHNVNPEWGSDPAVKGHIKLAKFLGRMDHKRTSKKAVM